ncbi:MAG: PHB depolymerase family esterase [Sedimentitalea sp.]
MLRNALLSLSFSMFATTAMAGCGPDPDACLLPDGEYHVALPTVAKPDAPVVIFLHGAGGNGAGVVRNSGTVRAMQARGYAVIAPSAKRREGSRIGPVWIFYPGWEGRNETVFLKDVVADAAQRFDLDPNRVLLAGFSAGGFMVNYLACDAPDTFAAYAPVSGGFWRPHPKDCAGPIKMLHTHGWRDSTVPLEGRVLGGGRFEQGDIFAGLEIWRTANQCASEKPSSFGETGQFLRRKWSDCAPGSALEFALFPGGHGVPKGWADMALDWFEAVTPPE